MFGSMEAQFGSGIFMTSAHERGGLISNSMKVKQSWALENRRESMALESWLLFRTLLSGLLHSRTTVVLSPHAGPHCLQGDSETGERG